MKVLRNFCLLFAVLVMMAGCKQKKKASLSGEEPVEVNDFIDFFPDAQPPYQFSDSSLLRRDKDSMLISYSVFTQFVPDSIASQLFPKGARPKIYSLDKLKVPKAETYLFVKTVAGEKRNALLLAFDKKDKFMDVLPVLQLDVNPATQQSVSVDKSYTINKIVTRKNPNGSASEGRDVYSLNQETRKLMLIQTDALDDKVTELINPIDTFSRKNKYSADYVAGKMNLVSIRDGRKSDRVSFFIHIETNNGECTAELKGEAMLKSPTVAEYREGGDPCVLRFSFTTSSVSMKELEGCGSHRGLRCSFNGNFPRKKEPKPKVSKKKPN